MYQLISFVILGFHERVIEYSQWTVSWACASTSLVTLFHVLHLYRCPLSFLETFSITKVSPVCKTVLLPYWVQIICEGGLLDALQKKVTLSYSRTVLFLGAETISATSEREANNNNSWSKKLFWRIRTSFFKTVLWIISTSVHKRRLTDYNIFIWIKHYSVELLTFV